MHKFNYKGFEFEIGLTTIESDNFIIARLLTRADDVFNKFSYELYVGNDYHPTDDQVVIKTHFTAVKRAKYEKESGKSYADLINYLEKLCKPEPVTLEDVYKECEGKTPVEIVKILKKYQYRMYQRNNTWSEWDEFDPLELSCSESYALGIRQIRPKEGC